MLSLCSKALLMLICGVTVSAIAGNKVGNGGNVVTCKTPDTLGAPARLLDFYESDINPKDADKTYEEILEQKFSQLKIASPKLSAQYLKRSKEIVNEIDFKSSTEFESIPDSLHLFKPLAKDCEVVQTAIRRLLVVGKEKRFLVRKDIWDQLDATNKAGLLSHEIIYEHLSKLGELTSIKARKINSYVFAGDIKANDFWKMMKELELPIYP